MVDSFTPTVRQVTDLAALVLKFGRVNRATYHPDGVRPESDTDHTVMLGILGVALARRWPWLRLNPGRVAEFALIHDLPEAHANDTQSFDLSAADLAAKRERERLAHEQIAVEFRPAFPDLLDLLDLYERQIEPEARFVRFLDKVLPKLTQSLNGGVQFHQLGKSQDDVIRAHAKQFVQLCEEYPEFAVDLGSLLEGASAACEAAYRRSEVTHGR